MISFQPSTHTYTVNGRPFISVTTLLSTWFPKFDADKTIARMNTDRPANEIKAEWEEKGRIAAELGTQLHQSIESYFKGTPAPLDTVEYGYFQDFVSKTNPTTFQVEWQVFHEPTSLIGTIDYVGKLEDGSLDLYDWKRSKGITKTNGFDKYALTECISHLPDANFWHYSLQLNTYKAILEEKYGKKVTELYLVVLHPNNTTYNLIPCADLSTEVSELFEERRKEINNL
jgi:ATP-dependent exoDNAse (exonuclease V) beta subunit